VIIAGAMRGWPALERWTPIIWRRRSGAAPVEYQGGRDGNPGLSIGAGPAPAGHAVRPLHREIAATGFGNDMYITAANSAANRRRWRRSRRTSARWTPI
jgi:hypothetical protein